MSPDFFLLTFDEDDMGGISEDLLYSQMKSWTMRIVDIYYMQ